MVLHCLVNAFSTSVNAHLMKNSFVIVFIRRWYLMHVDMIRKLRQLLIIKFAKKSFCTSGVSSTVAGGTEPNYVWGYVIIWSPLCRTQGQLNNTPLPLPFQVCVKTYDGRHVPVACVHVLIAIALFFPFFFPINFPVLSSGLPLVNIPFPLKDHP